MTSVRIGKSLAANESVSVPGSQRKPKTLLTGSLSSTPSLRAFSLKLSLFDVHDPKFIPAQAEDFWPHESIARHLILGES